VLGIAATGPASAIGLWPEATPVVEVAEAPAPKKRRGGRPRKVPAILEPPVDNDEPELAHVAGPDSKPRRSAGHHFRVESAKDEEMGDGFDTLADAQAFIRRNPDAVRIRRNSDDKIMPRVG
jgi:hypothetical protein